MLDNNMNSNKDRLLIFMSRNFSNQETIEKNFAIAKYATLVNIFESNNKFFKSSIEILRSLFEQNLKCEIDNFFSILQDKICLSRNEMNSNLEVYLVDSNLYSNYANHLLYRNSSNHFDQPVNILIDYKVCYFILIHYLN